jgi:hypothetical protein
MIPLPSPPDSQDPPHVGSGAFAGNAGYPCKYDSIRVQFVPWKVRLENEEAHFPTVAEIFMFT